MLHKTFSPHFVDHSPSLWVGPSQHSQASICYYYFYYNGKSTILSIRSLTPDNSMLTFLRRYANVTSILRRLKGQSRQRKENKNTVIFFSKKHSFHFYTNKGWLKMVCVEQRTSLQQKKSLPLLCTTESKNCQGRLSQDASSARWKSRIQLSAVLLLRQPSETLT